MSLVFPPFPIYDTPLQPRWACAEGNYIYTEDNRPFLDTISSWWVCLHGHNHPRLVEALRHQAGQMDQVMFAGCTHELAEKLAVQLSQLYPGGPWHSFFSDDGSTAVEVALKMAMHLHWLQRGLPAPGTRLRVLTLEGSYHGDTLGAMSAAERGVFTRPYNHWLFEAEELPVWPVLEFDAALTADEQNTIDNLTVCLQNEASYFAFIFEPRVQGAGGMRFIKQAYMDAIAHLCQKHGVYLIADEVMTGFGRTGQMFALEYANFEPDFVCLSKGLTGGFIPMGITLCAASLAQTLQAQPPRDRFLHGHSFTANPLACRVALESLAMLIDEPGPRQHQHRLLAEMKDHLQGNEHIENLRHTGSILAFDLVSTERTGYFNSLRMKAYEYFLERQILLRPLGNTLYVLPPYSFGPLEAEMLSEEIGAFLRKL